LKYQEQGAGNFATLHDTNAQKSLLGLSIFQEEIIDKFKEQYPTYIKYLDSKKEEFLAFLNYPETIRKLINSTNAVESV